MSTKRPRPPVRQGARSSTRGADAPGRAAGAPRGGRPSPAPRGARTFKAAATESALSERLQGMRVNLQTVTILGLIVLGVISLAPQAQTWYQQRQQIADLRAQVQQAKQDVAHMRIERKRWSDPVYIRSQARDRLYYVLPGEVSYLVMDANGISSSDVSGTVGAQLNQERSSVNISRNIIRAKKNWVNSLMQSVVRAGIEEPAATNPNTPVGGN